MRHQRYGAKYSHLARWRSLTAEQVLAIVAEYAKQDPTFRPVKVPDTRRWHVVFGGREFELLTTGPKFWDVRSGVGGGGAVDLVMHLAGVDFEGAVRLLTQRGL
jgi:hypothetical protein